MMKRLNRYFVLAGVLIVVVYASFTLAAYLQYPGPFSPMQNWLSDLGDLHQNPAGAGFYNLGILVTGLLLFLCFLSISAWRLKDQRIQNLMVTLSQLFGILGSLALAMSAVYPIDQIELHGFFSVSFYILTGSAFVFAMFALRYMADCPKWVLALAGITALVDIFSGAFNKATLLEWVTVALFLGLVFVLSVKVTPAFLKSGKSALQN